MLIERKHTADLIPADYNPRKDLKPGDPEYDKLKRSMEQFGYVEPVIWNKATGRVVGGHQRLKVLMDMGVTEVECVVVEMDEEREKNRERKMRAMGEQADVPIEPPEQTELLDACVSQAGVIGGGVPGGKCRVPCPYKIPCSILKMQKLQLAISQVAVKLRSLI